MSRTSKQRRDARKKKSTSLRPKSQRDAEHVDEPSPANARPESETTRDLRARRDGEQDADARLLGLLRHVYARVGEALQDTVCELYEELCPDDVDGFYELTVPEDAVAAITAEIIRQRAVTAPEAPETSAA